MRTHKSPAERAASCRRYAKVSRITGIVFWSLGAGFLILGVIVGMVTAWSSGLITILSSAIIIMNGTAIFTRASSFEETARTWDRIVRDEDRFWKTLR